MKKNKKNIIMALVLMFLIILAIISGYQIVTEPIPANIEFNPLI